MSRAAASGSRGHRGPEGPPAVLLLPILVLLAHAWYLKDFQVDDAFISFRYARNLAAGLGPVFNPGERVEGFSNPVYTFLIAGVAAISRQPEWIPVAGRVVGVAAAVFSLLLVASLPGVRWTAGSVLAAFLTAASTSFALWAVGGLETPLHGLLILAATAATLARPSTSAKQAGTGILLALVTLSRPEGALIAGVLFLVRLADPETRHEGGGHLMVLLGAAIPVAAWMAFRLVYYGDLLPNTYYAKDGPVGRSWNRGLWYLVSFVHHTGGKWLYAAAALAFLPKENRRVALVAAAVVGAQGLFILAVGGDWMDQHRFLAPVVPLVFLLVALGWAALAGFLVAPLRKWPGDRFATFVQAAALAIVWLAFLLPAYRLTEDQRKGGYVNASPYYDTVGRLVGLAAAPAWSVATHDIGAIGWYGRTRVVDLLGLVHPDLARNRITADALVSRSTPEIVILHYDNRPGAAERWRMVEAEDFEARYPVPASPVELPGSFRVRRDVLPEAQARLAAMPAELRADLTRLNEYLKTRQPDGHVLAAGSSNP